MDGSERHFWKWIQQNLATYEKWRGRKRDQRMISRFLVWIIGWILVLCKEKDNKGTERNSKEEIINSIWKPLSLMLVR